MLRHSLHPLVLTILGLAVLGLAVRLFTSPGSLLMQILVTVGIVAILLFVFRRFVMPKIMGEQAAYSPQQSAQVHKANARKKYAGAKSQKPDKKKRVSRPLVKRQSNVKLTVIEGKKNKKKNRALF
ncbi:SA1362 family protein [Evansella clarkii]|uniref:SA1362 family protein n=1 Tax=Evansella clarkii TaxID=79879 RepID=UPI000996B2C0|nr:SA1362 family protein [Evansella clarkii]